KARWAAPARAAPPDEAGYTGGHLPAMRRGSLGVPPSTARGPAPDPAPARRPPTAARPPRGGVAGRRRRARAGGRPPRAAVRPRAAIAGRLAGPARRERAR